MTLLCNRSNPANKAKLRQLLISSSLILLIAIPCFAVHAQAAGEDEPSAAESVIKAKPEQQSDENIQQRIGKIFSQIESLSNINANVNEGVVSLSGEVANEKQAQRALELANRLEGIVTVEDNIERTLDVEGNVAPVVDQFEEDLNRWLQASPLLAVALLVFLIVAFLGHYLAKWTTLWRRVAPNPFLAELIAYAIRVAAVILGLVVALNLMGATALMGTILGSAGVLGLAIGFAVRDSMENFISSIMLSVRQPFRANDHVVINEHEGIVMRLTSRATVLMTLDGNHLRIPNSTVFKAIILNYTRNPERRFEFELGIDAEDDPVAAMNTGLEAIRALEFVLAEPKPVAIVETVGDSNIVIKFMAWVDQKHTDFGKARSFAIRAAKNALEAQGFTLPEPIYRLRFDQSMAKLSVEAIDNATAAEGGGERKTAAAPIEQRGAQHAQQTDADLDVSPDTRLEEKANEERAQDSETNLLDHSRPVE